MASRIMHLAVAQGVEKLVSIKDTHRFRLGCILPDAPSSRLNGVHNSHYKERVFEGKKKTYNLEQFRGQFQEELLTDELYLGYYLHLVQDMVYRELVYQDYHWDPMPVGNVEALHNDYALLNTYVIENYQLVNNLIVPDGFEKECIQEIYGFDVARLMTGLRCDFEPYYQGEIFFFTEAMADEYMERAVALCVKEIQSLREGKPLLKALDYAWR